jgi:hypothetical protein
LANQIAVILYDFGSYKECINFAQKSNEIYVLKGEMQYIKNILDNKVVICKAKEKLDLDDEALKMSEKTFNLVTRSKIWNWNFGVYVIDVLKVTFKVKKC